jgi:hypothetical protein
MNSRCLLRIRLIIQLMQKKKVELAPRSTKARDRPRVRNKLLNRSDLTIFPEQDTIYHPAVRYKTEYKENLVPLEHNTSLKVPVHVTEQDLPRRKSKSKGEIRKKQFHSSLNDELKKQEPTRKKQLSIFTEEEFPMKKTIEDKKSQTKLKRKRTKQDIRKNKSKSK